MKTTPEYKQFCDSLVKSFDKDWSKSELKFDFAYQFLNHIPAHAWAPMIPIAIARWDGWPKNWAKAVKEIYEEWSRQAGHAGSGIVYNKDDDVRFPVQLMHEAFNILDSKGYIEYQHFCDRVGMPRTDRDRVEHKHKVYRHHNSKISQKSAEIGGNQRL